MPIDDIIDQYLRQKSEAIAKQKEMMLRDFLKTVPRKHWGRVEIVEDWSRGYPVFNGLYNEDRPLIWFRLRKPAGFWGWWEDRQRGKIIEREHDRQHVPCA